MVRKVRERGRDTWRGKQGRGDRDSCKPRKGSREKRREVERNERDRDGLRQEG